MNIGIDIDDTVTDTYETLVSLLGINYGMNIDKVLKQKLSYKTLKNMFTDYNDFAAKNYKTMATIVPLKKDAVDVLKKLKEDGHKLIFISARNYEEYEDPYEISYEYLKRNGIPFDKLIVNAKDKSKQCILENIDVFLDDNTQNCKSVEHTGIRTFQFDTVLNSEITTLNKVKSWEEFYKKICDIYA